MAREGIFAKVRKNCILGPRGVLGGSRVAGAPPVGPPGGRLWLGEVPPGKVVSFRLIDGPLKRPIDQMVRTV